MWHAHCRTQGMVFDSPRRNRDEAQSLTFPEPGSHCANRQLVTWDTGRTGRRSHILSLQGRLVMRVCRLVQVSTFALTIVAAAAVSHAQTQQPPNQVMPDLNAPRPIDIRDSVWL